MEKEQILDFYDKIKNMTNYKTKEVNPLFDKEYFIYGLPILKRYWSLLQIPQLFKQTQHKKASYFFALLSSKLDGIKNKKTSFSLTSGEFYIFSTLNRIYRYFISLYTDDQCKNLLDATLPKHNIPLNSSKMTSTVSFFVKLYPGKPFLDSSTTVSHYLKTLFSDKNELAFLLKELILLYIADINPATLKFKPLFDTKMLKNKTNYNDIIKILMKELESTQVLNDSTMTIAEILLLPIKKSPHDLAAQLSFLIEKFGFLLPKGIYFEALQALDVYKEETQKREAGFHDNTPIIEFRSNAPNQEFEPEQYSLDYDWMTNVVLIAKMVYVWLYQLSRKYNREISRLDQIPDEELDQLSRWGINAIWLIGVWKRSMASQKIKHLSGNKDAIASAYSLFSYEIAEDLGGYDSLIILKEKCAKRGIRLASDMVPNHTGIYSEWILNHPDWFIQTDEPPYPNYKFTGEDLSFSKEISIFIEDGYWTKQDAAVVFKYVDNRTGKVRYIYHGNDGTSTPWNDTAQLNYLLPEVREEVIKTIINVAKLFPIIRFDAAMTLTKRHYQRLWFPQPGQGGAIPSRAQFSMTKEEFDKKMPNEFWREVVDRISKEAPDTLLLAEAFWLMEGYFVRTLGMHRVYNSAFMNMLKMEENSKYRKTIKNVIEYDPQILKRFVNFMNNPDEKTAIEQFGKEKKYFGAAVMLVTMPGLPMFGHGQIEGFEEKYGMEYKRCYWDERVDVHLVREHEKKIFPLLKKRYLFSGSENFVLYDFYSGDKIDENVFVYSNSFLDEKAVIIYHNKFATTKGWFKTSTPFLKKSPETKLIRKTIGEALNLKNNPECFYIFKDYKDNLFYIRNSQELWEKGMYVELDAYDYHVFMDFKEVIDNEEKIWKQVHDELAGKGDSHIFTLYKLTKHNKMLKKFKDLLLLLKDEVSSLFSGKTRNSLPFDRIFAIVQEIFDYLNPSKNIKELEEKYELFKKFFALILRHKDFFSKIFFNDYDEALSMISLSLIIDLLYLKEESFLYEVIIPFLNREKILLLSNITIEESLNIIYESNLLTCKEGKISYGKFYDFLQKPYVKRFIKLNTYNDILWFNKERYEQLLFMMFLMSIKEKSSTSESLATMNVIYKRYKKLLTTANETNYQYTKTLNMILW